MYHQLTEEERYTVSLLKRQGQSMRSIARHLGRHPSTISREIQRNRCHANDGAYRASKAQERTNGRRRRSRSVRHHEQAIYTRIERLLENDQWSPEQIANRLAVEGIARISHMTIYRYVHEDALPRNTSIMQAHAGSGLALKHQACRWFVRYWRTIRPTWVKCNPKYQPIST